ncbi:type VII toxin-antitoxin system HepT family RNase toxin [Dethiobacter alkaliphilus]|uniref:DUF86 domain-containing protein n=1 Tax=Dethiobacter alkaliphilus AHT 1 TaxID=555088 RepID=C0GCZ9_DETAL|nr:DUF86 domain-containing protein [Dethiobacter alkaliphilus]EEG79084.1 protein of unknown function DUF86 [Dethiobacter alkaliphilus AHT 1]
MVNKDVLRKKVQYIEANLEKLAYLKQLSSQEFIEDFRNIETAKHLLQVSIEAMLDISNHIIARNRWGTPDKSADSIRLLREKGYFSEAEEELFTKMIKFRNRVVDLYHDINEKEVYKILQENLQDFSRFLKSIAKNNFSNPQK